jgi:hypothetical protein
MTSSAQQRPQPCPRPEAERQPSPAAPADRPSANLSSSAATDLGPQRPPLRTAAHVPLALHAAHHKSCRRFRVGPPVREQGRCAGARRHPAEGAPHCGGIYGRAASDRRTVLASRAAMEKLRQRAVQVRMVRLTSGSRALRPRILSNALPPARHELPSVNQWGIDVPRALRTGGRVATLLRHGWWPRRSPRCHRSANPSRRSRAAAPR